MNLGEKYVSRDVKVYPSLIDKNATIWLPW